MAFPGCRCFRVRALDQNELAAALRGFRFRCISCGSADRIGVHSLIPSDCIEDGLVVAVCANCHFKIGKRELDIRNNGRAQRLLRAWEDKYPEARAAHPDCFPDDYWSEE